MQSKAQSIAEYILELPEARQKPLTLVREAILKNIPKGFVQEMNYGMIGFVVPHTLYPSGYHCNPKLPLPFITIASQKNFIALYHMGIYTKPELLKWFIDEFPKHSTTKLDMGKSCIRFKKMDDIPFELIAQLVQKISVKDWIQTYETQLKK